MKTYSLKNHKGFSLVELLVSVAIFAIVITMSVGTLLVLVDANAKAQNMQEIMTNLNFAIDSMTREIRTGRGFYCTGSESALSGLDEHSSQDCSSGNSILSIVEGGESLTEGVAVPRVAYRFNSSENTIERRITSGSWYPLISDNVVVTDMSFHVDGTDSVFDGDTEQAYVVVSIEGYAGELSSVDSSFELQTTIVRRVLDI